MVTLSPLRSRLGPWIRIPSTNTWVRGETLSINTPCSSKKIRAQTPSISGSFHTISQEAEDPIVREFAKVKTTCFFFGFPWNTSNFNAIPGASTSFGTLRFFLCERATATIRTIKTAAPPPAAIIQMGGKDASSSPSSASEATGPEETEGVLGSCEDSTWGSPLTVPSAGGELPCGAELSGSLATPQNSCGHGLNPKKRQSHLPPGRTAVLPA